MMNHWERTTIVVGILLLSGVTQLTCATHTMQNTAITSISQTPDIQQQDKKEYPGRGWIYVGGSGPNNYTTIQAGINAANPDDTVYVYAGVYNENIVINKAITVRGQQASTTIIDGRSLGHVVTITSNNVLFTDFSVRNGNSYGIYVNTVASVSIERCVSSNNAMYGIYLYHAPFCCVKNSQSFSNHRYGMSIESSPNCQLISCIVHDNDNANYHDHSIVLTASNNALVQDCICYNGYYGIVVDYSTNCSVLHCQSYNNAGYGIHVYFSDTTLVKDCTSYNNSGFAIFVERSSHCTIQHCVTYESLCGIMIFSVSNYNLVNDCTAYGTDWEGIYLRMNCQYNIVKNCRVYQNYEGISVFWESSHNLIYHNTLYENGNNAYDDGINQWDSSHPGGGNYYDDYTGVDVYSGINQNKPGIDGIGDTPYIIVGTSNMDRYPLMHRFRLGDLNNDGVVSFADINPFVAALSGLDYFYSYYPTGTWMAADCNDDGVVSFADINPFVALLSG